MEGSSEKGIVVCDLDLKGQCEFPCNNEGEMRTCVKKGLWKELSLTTSKVGPKLFEMKRVVCA